MKKTKVSNNMIRRLPRYLRKLDELSEHGIIRISSAELGRQMGITSSQIRQDLSAFGEFGLQGYGYNVLELRNEIGGILGIHNGFRAILIGAGKLGSALLNNFSFANCGIDLKCAFDVNPDLIGGTIEGIPVYDLNCLPIYLQEQTIDIAVLTVPKAAVSAVIRVLSDNGVEAVWNFTNVELDSKNSSMIVENLHFSDSLLALSYFLSERREAQIKRLA